MKLLTIAGELSGDTHGGALLAGLRERLPNLAITGIGGPAMLKAGLQPLFPLAALQVHGLLEVISHLPRLYRILWDVERQLDENRPDALLLIDYPGFNLKLAQAAKRRAIPVYYYSSPQIWAWRGRRIRTIAKAVDLMIVLFPFEPALYQSVGVEAHFLGHPLVGVRAHPAAVAQLKHQVAAPEGVPIVALMPGSRPSELRRHLRVLLEAMKLCERQGFRGRYVIPVAPSLAMEKVHMEEVQMEVEASGLPVLALEDAFLPLLGAADFAVTASGTATLQTALAGIPFLVVYRMSPLTFFLAKRMAYLSHISIVNILADKEVAPELLQHEFTPEAVRDAFLSLVSDPERRAAMKADLQAVAGQLGEPGAYGRAADLLAERLRGLA
ncbi:MAG: lipid-A-disaccharide synthase [bacterium]